MARRRKTPEEAGKEADEIIENNLKAANTSDEPTIDENLDSLDGDEGKDSGDDFDLSSLETEPKEDVAGEDNSNFKHQYEVLQGKYNTELKRLSDELSRVMAQNQQLIAEINKREQTSTVDGNLDDDLKILKEQYPNIYKGVMALFRSESPNIVKGTEAKVNSVANRVIANDRERYFDTLSKAVPRWEAINKHPVFLKWLSQRDRYTGATKGMLLRRAFDNMDAETTITFFSDFMNEKGIRNKAAKETDDGNIAPNTSGGNPPPRKELGAITRSEIKKFYDDKAKGRYSGSQEEADKFERRIMTAIKEGKVLEK